MTAAAGTVGHVPALSGRERVLRTVAHRPVDRVPLFLPVTMHGALELGVTLGEYYASARLVAEGQLRLRAKYRNDFLYPFFYGAIEHEAFGGEVEYFEDGPPNAVAPLLSSIDRLADLRAPIVRESLPLRRVLDAIQILAAANAGESIVAGVVLSPFSLPVLQLGFEQYLNLLHEQPRKVGELIAFNERFTVEWANAQVSAGADAIGYFDPVASPTLIPHRLFTSHGLPVMRRTMAAIKAPCAALLGAGLSLPIIDDLASSGAVIVGASCMEDLRVVKAAAAGRLAVMGNLNGLQMRHWTQQDAQAEVRRALSRAARGGGFILSESHGEIPLQVPADVLLAISHAALEYGRYPMVDSIEDSGVSDVHPPAGRG